MLYVTYVINFLLMILVPLLLGWFLVRRFGLSWRLFVIGGVTFVLAQVFHIPLNIGLTVAFRQELLPGPPQQYQLIFNAIVLGLTAALTEETARYFVLRTTLKQARSWRQAVVFGAGHGGVEAILVGVLAALAYIGMVLLRQNPDLLSALPAEQLQAANNQLQAYWSAPWYLSILGAAERVFTLCVHISLAVLVMQVFLRNNILWLFLAMAWHWLINAVAAYSLPTFGPLATEGIIGLMALISLGVIFVLRTAEPEVAPEPDELFDDSELVAPPALPPTPEALDRSRYTS